MIAADDRQIDAGFEDRSGPSDDRERSITPAVRLYLGAGKHFHRIEGGGGGNEGRRIDRTARRIVGGGEIEERLVFFQHDADTHGDAPVVDTVIVEPVFAVIFARRQIRDGGPHLRLGPVVQRRDGAVDRFQPMPLVEVLQSQIGRPGRGHLRQNVAFAFRRTAYIGQHEIELLAVGAVGGEQAHRRDTQPFLPGVRRVRDVAAGNSTTDIGPMRQADGESLQRSLNEDRPDRLHVRQMIAAHFRQVQEPHIAGRHSLRRNAFQKLLHRETHHAEMHRNIAPLRDHIAGRIG